MKINNLKRSLVLVVSALCLIVFAGSKAYTAGSASFELSSTTQNVLINESVTVTVFTNSSEPVNAVEAIIGYDPAFLQYVSVDSSGSAYDFGLPISTSSNQVTIPRGVMGGLSATGKGKVAQINFRALQEGSTSVTIVAGSSIIRTSDTVNVWNEQVPSVNVAISKPAPATPPQQQPTSNQNETQNTLTQNTSPQTQTVSSQESPAPSVPSSNQQAVDTPAVVAPENQLNGYMVAIQIFDSNKTGIANIDVQIGDKKASTDDMGIASFTEVLAGNYTVKIPGREFTISVQEGDMAGVQSFSFTLPSRNYDFIIAIAVALLLIALIGLAVWFLRKKRSASVINEPYDYIEESSPEIEKKEIYIEPATPPAPETVFKPSNDENSKND